MPSAEYTQIALQRLQGQSRTHAFLWWISPTLTLPFFYSCFSLDMTLFDQGNPVTAGKRATLQAAHRWQLRLTDLLVSDALCWVFDNYPSIASATVNLFNHMYIN